MRVPLEVQVARRREWRARRGYRAGREAERARKRQEAAEAKARLIIELVLAELGVRPRPAPNLSPGWRHPAGFRSWP